MIKIAHMAIAAAMLAASAGAASAQDYRGHDSDGMRREAAPHARWEGHPYAPAAYGYAAPSGHYGYGPEREGDGPNVGAIVFGAIAGGMIAAMLANGQAQ
jgi:hypothetical protein